MNLHTFIKTSKDYISCFVKYGAAVIVAPFMAYSGAWN